MILFSFMPKYIEKVVLADNTVQRNHIITGGFIFYLSLLKEINDLILFDF